MSRLRVAAFVLLVLLQYRAYELSWGGPALGPDPTLAAGSMTSGTSAIFSVVQQKRAPAVSAGDPVSVRTNKCSKYLSDVSANGTLDTACAKRSHSVYLGVWQAGMPQDMNALFTFEHHAGKKAAIVMIWRDFGSSKNTLDVSWLQAIADNGSIPFISWSPANWDAGTIQSPYSLSAIASGGDDTYIRGWARELASYGRPVFLRWGPEMNGDWYPWGNQPKAYVAAWRHIHDVFFSEGAANVLWVWTPNVFWPGSRAKAPMPFYPGNHYVDWVGLAGYNVPGQGWMSFRQLFTYSYRTLSARLRKPLIIGEMGSGEATPRQARKGKSKAKWIVTALTVDIPRMKRVDAVIWFNEDKTRTEMCNCDWSIESSIASQRAFARAVRTPMYRARWFYARTGIGTW